MRFPSFVVLFMLASSLSAQTVVQVEKPEFRALVAENARLEKIATGFQFLEGPAWNNHDYEMIFSDIPADRLYRFDPAAPTEQPTNVFREPSHGANGNTYDANDNLFTCEHATRRVTVTRPDGAVEILADRFQGKELNSPNDVVVKRDGTVWFTDPTYGRGKQPREQSANHVFRLDPRTRELFPVASDFDQPNGLCFSPDEKHLYIADSGEPHHVRVFDVRADNTLADGRVFCVIEPGVPDGMRCDRDGNLWCTAGDGIHVYNPNGERLGKILVSETPSNLCIGGPTGKELYITARTSLYRVLVSTAAPPPQ